MHQVTTSLVIIYSTDVDIVRIFKFTLSIACIFVEKDNSILLYYQSSTGRKSWTFP